MRRRQALRVGGRVLVLSAAVGGLAFSYPGGPARLYTDVAEYRQHNEQLADNRQTLRQLETATTFAHDRWRLKEELRDQLAQGTVPLAGAADAFLQAVSAEPELLPLYRNAVPGASDEERMAVNLIREVFAVMPLTDDRRQALLAQFRTTYGTDYPLPVLPPPAAARTSAAGDALARP